MHHGIGLLNYIHIAYSLSVYIIYMYIPDIRKLRAASNIPATSYRK